MGTVIRGNFGLSRSPQAVSADERSEPIPTNFQYWTLKKTAVGICYIVGWFDDPKQAVVSSAVIALDHHTNRALTINGNWYSLGQFESCAPHQAQAMWEQFATTYSLPQIVPLDPNITPEEFYGDPLDALAAVWACSSDEGWANVMNLLTKYNISG